MKKVFIISVLIFAFHVNTYCQEPASSIKVNDKRDTNEMPNSFYKSVTADFKLDDVIGIPAKNYSTNLTIAPWSDNSGGFVHQLNFNDGGIFYRTGTYQPSIWKNWKKLLVTDLEGNIEGNIGLVGNIELIGTAATLNTQSNVSLGLSNKGVRGGKHLWRIYTASFAGDKGIASNAYEIWEYPELTSNLSETPTLQRLAIQTNRDKNKCSPVIIGPMGSLNVGYGSGFISSDINDLSVNGNVGIGTTNTNGYKLAVNGSIRAKEIWVESNWADFVFNPDYKLPTLKEVELYIKEKGHLPGIPPEKEIKSNGVNLGEINVKLLQKIEEQMMYIINLQKQIEDLNTRLKRME